MKTPTLIGRSRYTLLGAVILSIFAIAMASRSKPSGGVTFGPNNEFIKIPQITDLSDKDQKDLNEILKHSDKQLYKIDTFKNGNGKHIGTLGCITASNVSECSAKAKEGGVSDVAIQISAPFAKDTQRTNTTFSCNIPLQLQDKARELIDKVTPILERYKAENHKKK